MVDLIAQTIVENLDTDELAKTLDVYAVRLSLVETGNALAVAVETDVVQNQTVVAGPNLTITISVNKTE